MAGRVLVAMPAIRVVVTLEVVTVMAFVPREMSPLVVEVAEPVSLTMVCIATGVVNGGVSDMAVLAIGPFLVVLIVSA